MALAARFFDQVKLLVSLLPLIERQTCFALKGGTAINLFIRDMPRLSVDIDLVFLPVKEREISLTEIDRALHSIAEDAEKTIPGSRVHFPRSNGAAKLLVASKGASVKIEVSPVLRGSLKPPLHQDVALSVQKTFGYARIPVLSFEELYAGKICAALDRQHPRDLFDIYQLLLNEGISTDLKDAFLVYLLCHNRPIVELLNPARLDIRSAYEGEFAGMVDEPISMQTLIDCREELIRQITHSLSESDKNFLLAVKRGQVDWDKFIYSEAKDLPGVQWKLHNLNRMPSQKRREAANKLEDFLSET